MGLKQNITELKEGYVYNIIIMGEDKELQYVVVSLLEKREGNEYDFRDIDIIYEHPDFQDSNTSWHLNVDVRDLLLNSYVFLELGYKDDYVEYFL